MKLFIALVLFICPLSLFAQSPVPLKYKPTKSVDVQDIKLLLASGQPNKLIGWSNAKVTLREYIYVPDASDSIKVGKRMVRLDNSANFPPKWIVENYLDNKGKPFDGNIVIIDGQKQQ